MTAALAAVAAVLLVAVVILTVSLIRSRRAARRAEARATQLAGRVEETARLLEEAERQRRNADARVATAESRLQVAEQRAGEAERRAGDAERRVGEAMRRAEEAERSATGSAGADAVWGMERFRVEREWLDVVGPGVPLPVPWDGSLAPVVATELSVIREVMGTPSDLALDSPARLDDPVRACGLARLGVELLRTLARSGEPMEVTVAGEELRVAQAPAPGEAPPDLGALAEAARAAGLDLATDGSHPGVSVTLCPAPH